MHTWDDEKKETEGGLKGIMAAAVENLGELESYPKMLQGCLTRGVIHQSDFSSPSVSHSSLPLPLSSLQRNHFPLSRGVTFIKDAGGFVASCQSLG